MLLLFSNLHLHSLSLTHSLTHTHRTGPSWEQRVTLHQIIPVSPLLFSTLWVIVVMYEAWYSMTIRPLHMVVSAYTLYMVITLDVLCVPCRQIMGSHMPCEDRSPSNSPPTSGERNPRTIQRTVYNIELICWDTASMPWSCITPALTVVFPKLGIVAINKAVSVFRLANVALSFDLFKLHHIMTPSLKDKTSVSLYFAH